MLTNSQLGTLFLYLSVCQSLRLDSKVVDFSFNNKLRTKKQDSLRLAVQSDSNECATYTFNKEQWRDIMSNHDLPTAMVTFPQMFAPVPDKCLAPLPPIDRKLPVSFIQTETSDKAIRVAWNWAVDRSSGWNFAKNTAKLIWGEDQPLTFVELPRNTSSVPLTNFDVFIGIGWFLDSRFRDVRLASEPMQLKDGDLKGLVHPRVHKAYKANKRPVALTFNAERWFATDANKYDIMLSTSETEVRDLQGSLATLFPLVQQSLMEKDKMDLDALYAAKSDVPVKDQFCAFLVSACHKNEYRQEAAVRMAFFDVLAEKYKRCGSFRHHCRGDEKIDPAVKFERQQLARTATMYQPYKFTINFENSYEEGYITEKIMDGIQARTIPIYFGAPDIEKWINPARFINCNFNPHAKISLKESLAKVPKEEFESLINDVKNTYRKELEECVEQVKRVDQDPDLYRQMVQAPALLRDSQWDMPKVGAAMKHIIARLREM